MLISIIVPVYNASNYIKKCIESIQKQRHHEFECILVDDGSNDNSLELCKSLTKGDSRFIILTQTNGGASSARNLGVHYSSGDYICFIDSDDYVSENYVSDLFEDLLSGDKQTDLVIHGMMRYSHDKVIDRGMHVDGLYYLKENAESFFNEINIERYGGPVCKLFCKRIIEENGLRFNTGIKLAEDLDFLLRYLPFCNNIKVSAKNNYFYIENPVSATTRLYSFDQELYGLNSLATSWSKLCNTYQVKRLVDLRGGSVAYLVTRCIFSIYQQGYSFMSRMQCYNTIDNDYIYLYKKFRKETSLFMKTISFLVGRRMFLVSDLLLYFRLRK